ncbi:hypothetical protein B0H14DRAFT_2576068 [Mycena olivaceomarginata]|nr:hypothetical protein B0H14DRAFT_2576068 [Mycena olivaceomarginata]
MPSSAASASAARASSARLLLSCCNNSEEGGLDGKIERFSKVLERSGIAELLIYQIPTSPNRNTRSNCGTKIMQAYCHQTLQQQATISGFHPRHHGKPATGVLSEEWFKPLMAKTSSNHQYWFKPLMVQTIDGSNPFKPLMAQAFKPSTLVQTIDGFKPVQTINECWFKPVWLELTQNRK